jgi:hypothetical protein
VPTATKKIWRDISLNVLGGLLAYPCAHGLVMGLGYFLYVPNGIATAIFVTTYSGLVLIFVVRIWDDVKVLTDDLKILIILNENESVSSDTYLQPIHTKLFDEETYEFFQRLLGGLPSEYTVIKLNRLFFLNAISSLPTSKLQDLVSNQTAFSQILGRLRADGFIRTDGFSFSIQLGQWELKREEMMEQKSELEKWEEIATQVIEQNEEQGNSISPQQ